MLYLILTSDFFQALLSQAAAPYFWPAAGLTVLLVIVCCFLE